MKFFIECSALTRQMWLRFPCRLAVGQSPLVFYTGFPSPTASEEAWTMTASTAEPNEEDGDEGGPQDPWRKASHVETILGIAASVVTIFLGALAVAKGLR